MEGQFEGASIAYFLYFVAYFCLEYLHLLEECIKEGQPSTFNPEDLNESLQNAITKLDVGVFNVSIKFARRLWNLSVQASRFHKLTDGNESNPQAPVPLSLVCTLFHIH